MNQLIRTSSFFIGMIVYCHLGRERERYSSRFHHVSAVHPAGESRLVNNLSMLLVSFYTNLYLVREATGHIPFWNRISAFILNLKYFFINSYFVHEATGHIIELN